MWINLSIFLLSISLSNIVLLHNLLNNLLRWHLPSVKLRELKIIVNINLKGTGWDQTRWELVSNEPGPHAVAPLVNCYLSVKLREWYSKDLEHIFSRYYEAEEAHLHNADNLSCKLPACTRWVFSSLDWHFGSNGFNILLDIQEVPLVGSRGAVENTHTSPHDI